MSLKGSERERMVSPSGSHLDPLLALIFLGVFPWRGWGVMQMEDSASCVGRGWIGIGVIRSG